MKPISEAPTGVDTRDMLVVHGCSTTSRPRRPTCSP